MYINNAIKWIKLLIASRYRLISACCIDWPLFATYSHAYNNPQIEKFQHWSYEHRLLPSAPLSSSKGYKVVCLICLCSTVKSEFHYSIEAYSNEVRYLPVLCFPVVCLRFLGLLRILDCPLVYTIRDKVYVE